MEAETKFESRPAITSECRSKQGTIKVVSKTLIVKTADLKAVTRLTCARFQVHISRPIISTMLTA